MENLRASDSHTGDDVRHVDHGRKCAANEGVMRARSSLAMLGETHGVLGLAVVFKGPRFERLVERLAEDVAVGATLLLGELRQDPHLKLLTNGNREEVAAKDEGRGIGGLELEEGEAKVGRKVESKNEPPKFSITQSQHENLHL